MRILLTGGTGQLGWELRRTLAPRGSVHAPDREDLDLADLQSIRDAVNRIEPDLIVNAAAYNDVDRAEQEPDVAFRINAEAPSTLAEEARQLGAVLIHYSTDYVFSGEADGPYTEEDEPSPVNTYGRSKLEGERAVAGAGAPHFIFRLSWVYGRRRDNFVNTMLRLFREREELQVVDDQWGSPTWCRTAAEVTAQVLAVVSGDEGEPIQELRDPRGLYHLAVRGRVSRFEQALAIQRHARRVRPSAEFGECALEPISSSEYPAEARRPRSTPLSSVRLEQTFDFSLPEWEGDLVRCLEDRLCITV